MGNTESSSRSEYACNDYQLAIELSKQLESLLARELGVTGRGLHEKVASVDGLLPARAVRAMRYVASVRNQLIHDDKVTALPDRGYFIRRFETARAETQAAIDKKGWRGRPATSASGGFVVS